MKSGWRRFALVFTVAAVVYVFLAAGYIDTGDADPSYYTARALLERHSFEVRPPWPDSQFYRWIGGGGWVSKMGLLMPLLYLPGVWLAGTAHALTGLPEPLLAHFLISMVNPILTACLIALLDATLHREGWDSRRSLGLAAVAGLATLLLPYSKTAHREPALALCLLGGLAFVYRGSDRAPWRFAAAGTALALGLLGKHAFAVPAAPLVVFLSLEAWRAPHRPKALVALGLPLVAAGLVWAAFSRIEFHSILDVGYDRPVTSIGGAAWSTPFFIGMYQQLFSPRTGYLFYTPLVLLLWRKRKTGSRELAILASFFAQACLYACWYSPTGGPALGPRYLVAVTPLLFLMAEPSLWHGRTSRALATALLIWSVVIQLAATSVRMQVYWTLQSRAGVALRAPQWWANLEIFAHKLSGREDVYRIEGHEIDLRDASTLVGLNYWWLHLRRAKQIPQPSIGPRRTLSPEKLRQAALPVGKDA
jgi:hypothetical protein